MARECKNAGNPLPKFEEIGGGFSVTLRFKEPIITVSVSPTTLTERQHKIMAVLKHGPLNRQQIMSELGTKITDRMMQIELGKLKKLNLITSSGKGKAFLWHVTSD